MRKLMFGALLGSALLATGAIAQQATTPSAPSPMRERVPMADMTRAQAGERAAQQFDRLDANRDGTLDQSDMQARMLARQAERFTSLDTDRNGSISRAEWDAGHQMMMSRRGERHAAMGQRMGRGGAMRDGMMMRRGGAGLGQQGATPGTARSPLTRDAFVNSAYALFDALDANRDGTVTQAERAARRAEMRQQRQR